MRSLSPAPIIDAEGRAAARLEGAAEWTARRQAPFALRRERRYRGDGWRNGRRRRSVEVSVADAEPRRDGGAGSRFGGSGFGLAVATVALTVVATNVAVGVFLWLAIDARLTNLEADVREIRVGMNDINARLAELSARVARLEGNSA